MQWRWQRETVPGDPWTNMAMDAELLADLLAERTQLPTVRIYQWDRPSVSIGRLQVQEAVIRKYPELTWVRRPTGGRAVLHGNDLTITVATRSQWLPGVVGQGVLPSYRTIMAGIREAFRECGIPTVFGTPRQSRQTAGIVNCFEVAAGCDLLDCRSGRKIAGSAQRREQNVILQQTSLPLEFLPEIEAFIQSVQLGFQKALLVDQWFVN